MADEVVQVVKRAEVFKKTNGDWHPAYKLGSWHEGRPPNLTRLVKVSLILYADGSARVCAWGGDDYGLEIDYDHGDDDAIDPIGRATREFGEIMFEERVDPAWLIKRGFKEA